MYISISVFRSRVKEEKSPNVCTVCLSALRREESGQKCEGNDSKKWLLRSGRLVILKLSGKADQKCEKTETAGCPGKGKGMEFLTLKPVFKQMIWGGNRLRTDFGYEIPGGNTGECWAISAHPNGDCEIADGAYAGKTLSWLWDNHRELFGGMEGDRFPLLIKIIDAKNDLSIQVHPDDAYAAAHENGSLGKMECWYVLDAKAGETIVIGHNAANHEELKRMIEEKRWKELIREVPVKKGDFFQINPGCVHAIKGGTLILETQQNSDITYRVYDYDRLQDGKPRTLHVKQSIDVIQAPFVPQATQETTETVGGAKIETLVTCRYYTVKKVSLNGSAAWSWDRPFIDVSVIDGQGTIGGCLVKKGTHLLIPFGYGEIRMEGTMQLICSSAEQKEKAEA